MIDSKNLHELTEVQLRSDSLAEDAFFALLARETASELDCAAERGQSLIDGIGLPVLIEDLLFKVPKLAKLEADLKVQRDRGSQLHKELDRARAGLVPNSVASLRKEIFEGEREARRMEAMRRSLYASVQFSEYPEVSGLLRELIRKPALVKDSQALREKVQAVYRKQINAFQSEKERLIKASATGGDGLSKQDKHQLASDPLLMRTALDRLGKENSNDRKVLEALACRIDARYGSGSDYLELAAFGGSALLSAGAGVAVKMAKAPVAALAASNAGLVARARGLISLRGARVLQAAAIAADFGLAGSTAANACARSGGFKLAARRGGGQALACAETTGVEIIAEDNCALEAAFATLSLGAASAFSYAEFASGLRFIGDAAGSAGLKAEAKFMGYMDELTHGRAGLPKGRIDKIPAAVQYPLPKEFLARVRQSPALKGLKESYGNGKGLVISLPDEDPMLLATGRFSTDRKGEAIQSAFVRKVIQEIFPEAEVRTAKTVSGEKAILSLGVVDRAEHGKLRDRWANLDMTDLKLANPGPGQLARAEVRRVIGFPEDAKIISLNNAINTGPEEIAELVHATFKGGPEIVVVSQSLRPKAIASTMEEMAKALPSGYRVVRLSELRNARVKEGEKLVVFNDSAGRMHAIYSAVDGSVTAGAVNIAEPLLAKAPSVIFDTNSKYMFGYDKATFSEALSAAKASGGAETVTDPKELAGKVGAILKGESSSLKGAFHPPYAIVDSASGDAPVDRMLRHLNEVLDEKVTDAGLSQRFPGFMARHDQVAAMKISAVNDFNRSILATGPDDYIKSPAEAFYHFRPRAFSRLSPAMQSEVRAAYGNVVESLRSLASGTDVRADSARRVLQLLPRTELPVATPL